MSRHRTEDRVRASLPAAGHLGPRSTWIPPSPSQSAWRPTPRTRCAPGWPVTRRVGGRTRRFAKWSAICSFALGMAGQIAYHLLAQAGAAERHGPSPPSCRACRSWSWPWGPHWPTCCAPTPAPPRKRHPAGGQDQPRRRALPAPPGTRQHRSRTSPQAMGQDNPGPSATQDRPVPVPDRTAVRTSTPIHAETGRARRPPAGLPLRAVRYPGAPCATRA